MELLFSSNIRSTVRDNLIISVYLQGELCVKILSDVMELLFSSNIRSTVRENLIINVYLQVELCVKILSDVMELLFCSNIGSTVHDVSEIMLTMLRTVIQTTIAMDRESALVVSRELTITSEPYLLTDVTRVSYVVGSPGRRYDLHLQTDAALSLRGVHHSLRDCHRSPRLPHGDPVSLQGSCLKASLSQGLV